VSKRSAGLLLYRGPEPEVLLVHPGGPFWARKDDGAWSIPKGEYEEGEEPEAAARREFAEETGYEPAGSALALGSFRQSAAKTVMVWALEGDFDPATLQSNTFTMEWPPRSGRQAEFPEVDRAEWFPVELARERINPAQAEFLDRLVGLVTPPGV
jgi:predicted NUDIX family NTP pyrophosphohydrolase